MRNLRVSVAGLSGMAVILLGLPINYANARPVSGRYRVRPIERTIGGSLAMTERRVRENILP